ncbi:MAG TPA: histidine phosphatase family protein [Caulobacteraceae bacterium]|nr:histidine phosphatase family protein [Caulobacteraceae bacterium]
MTRLYMIRHGRPSATWGEHAGPDPGLDAAGQAQARAAAEALLALPPGERPLRVMSSPLLRCRETAQPFAAVLGAAIEVEPRFGEIPTPSALTAAERGPWLRNAFQANWTDVRGDIDYDLWRRAVGEALAEQADNTAIFSHFVAINAALSCVSGEPRVLTFRPDHASITVFELRGGRLELVARGPEAQTQVL